MAKNLIKVEQSNQQESKNNKKGNEQYRCGDQSCGKFYHSYTAFYNHCKKSHGGQFPKNSLFNDKLFQGPTKNRGRPRIKKNQAKDLVQIQSMKKQNQLIQFMGTLKTKKSDELIVYVDNPVDRVQAAIVQVKEWLRKSRGQLKQDDIDYLLQLEDFNKIIDENDLPEFYDPIETHLYPDKLDSYSFSSVYNFMMREDMRQKFQIKYEDRELLYKIITCWLARILSQKLYNQVLYIIMQLQRGKLESQEHNSFEKMNLDLLYDKKTTLKLKIMQFFDSFMKQHDRKGMSDRGSTGKRNHSGSLPQMPQRRFAQDGDDDQQDDQDDQ